MSLYVKTVQAAMLAGMGLTLMSCGDGNDNAALAQQAPGKAFVAPRVFQAAGPTVASIQGTVDEYRTALGGQNNANTVGPLPDGRREINWDGGSPANVTTAVVGTPFSGFLATRGALFTTPGTGFVQAPASGLADTFQNPTYATIFQAFSPQRLFSPIGSTVTDMQFFVPGPGPNSLPATTRAFGAVFTDVDLPNGSGVEFANGNRPPSTFIECFGTDGGLLYKSAIPASPGDKSVSFIGVMFEDARINAVRITSGDTTPGPNDDGQHDVVVMDDFVFGEPQPKL